jgi:hypothetical protein
MKRLFILFALLPLAFSCDDSDDIRCIAGEVIFYDGCQGVSVIEVDGHWNIGDSLETYQKRLVNAIQVPGKLDLGRGFFRIRDFRSGDEKPADPAFLCLAIYIPYDVPAYTVIARSDLGCR